MGTNRTLGRTIPEAWPAGPRLKLCAGAKQGRITTDAVIHAVFLVIPINTGKSSFSTALTRHLKLGWAELLPPFFRSAFHPISTCDWRTRQD